MSRKARQILILLSVLFAMMATRWCLLRFQKKEGFISLQEFVNSFQRARTQTENKLAYDNWIGYMYQNPSTSAKSLNDFKRRAFADQCVFRETWSDEIPSGMDRPNAPTDKFVANASYGQFLKCLATSPDCFQYLNDFRARFFEPGCSFVSQNQSLYAANYSTVF